ncbi:hypothetical protein B0H13DRAFT_2651158 [Mycena leptocephala]|nr:hypothetical protein B0H13DRAFT_2651158 [Mycena leptocephala]
MAMTNEHVFTFAMNLASCCKTRLLTTVPQNKILNSGYSNSSSNYPHKNSHGPRNNHRTVNPIASPTVLFRPNVQVTEKLSAISASKKYEIREHLVEIVQYSRRPPLVHKRPVHAPRTRAPLYLSPPPGPPWPILRASPMYAPMGALCQPGPRCRAITGSATASASGTGTRIGISVSGNAIGSENGVDLICAQAGEGGGHTGDINIPASILIPACVDAVKGHKSPLTGLTGTGKPVYVIGAGALCTTAGGSPGRYPLRRRRRGEHSKKHKELVCSTGFEDAILMLIFTGRSLRVRRTPYIEDWSQELTGKNKLPHEVELEKRPQISLENRPWVMGRVSAVSLPLAFSPRQPPSNLTQFSSLANSLTTCSRPKLSSTTWFATLPSSCSGDKYLKARL